VLAKCWPQERMSSCTVCVIKRLIRLCPESDGRPLVARTYYTLSVIPPSIFYGLLMITYNNVLYYPETKHLFSPYIEFTLPKDRPLAIEKCQHSVKPVTKECPTHKQSVVFLCPSFVNRRNLSVRKPGRIKCIESFR
jgi:hypothetical protein